MKRFLVFGLLLMNLITFSQRDTLFYQNGVIREIVTLKSSLFKKYHHAYFDEDGELFKTGTKIDGEKTGEWEYLRNYDGKKYYGKSQYAGGVMVWDSVFYVLGEKHLLSETTLVNADKIKTGKLKCGESIVEFDSTYQFVQQFYPITGKKKRTFHRHSGKELHGEDKHYTKAGVLFTSKNYICGEKTGKYYEYFSSGKVKIETELLDGYINGFYVEYDPFGNEVIKGYAENGTVKRAWYKYNLRGEKKYKYYPSGSSSYTPRLTVETVEDIAWKTYYQAPKKTTYTAPKKKTYTAPKKTYSAPKKKYKAKRTPIWDPYSYSGMSVTYSDSLSLWGLDFAFDNWIGGMQFKMTDKEDGGITRELEIAKPYIGYAPKVYRSMFLQFGVGFNSYYESHYYGTNWDDPIYKKEDIGYTAFGGIIFNMVGDAGTGLSVGVSAEYDQVIDGFNFMWRAGISFD